MSARITNPQQEGTRKAAILVASLDPATADALLDQMGPERAGRVRQVMVELGEVDPREQQRVIEEFFRIGPMMPRQQPPGIELDARLARKLGLPTTGLAAPALAESLPSDGPPFHFLQDAEADKLARALVVERPQTIALVLAHLRPEQAGAVLVRLPSAQQVEVIRRLVDLEETDPEIMREVERGLWARLSQQVHVKRRRVAGLSAVAGILQASDNQIAGRILHNLAAYDQPLAEKLGPPALAFDDLVHVDDAALSALLQAADPAVVTVALVGTSPELIERFLSPLSPAEAGRMRHKLNHPGPIRLRDVEDARLEITNLVRHLAMMGRIGLPVVSPR